MDPGIYTDVLPGIQDGYSLALSDFLGADIPCYPSMQSDLHAGIGVNGSEVRLPYTFIHSTSMPLVVTVFLL